MRLWKASVVCMALLFASAAKADDAPPSAERIRSAASEFDAGRRAFGEKDYEGAAAHFENAYHDAASASALRQAIRARRKAGDLGRAATLANVATLKYAKDASTMAVAREVLKEAQKKLERLTVHCTPDCGIASDGKAVSSEDAPETVFYVEPGDHELVVSWTGDRTKTSIVSATAGGDETLTFEAPPPRVAAVVALPPPPPPPPASAKPLSPVFFYSGAALTLVSLGVTIWSGVDAENNPGAAAVRRDCAGQGTSCAEYQQGLSAQLRTNVLIGTTAALGAATGVVGVFFTRWPGKTGESRPTPLSGAVVPLLGPGGGGGQVVLRGTF